MKNFLITYHFKNGTTEEWHKSITDFINDLQNDPILKDRISYKCMKNAKNDEYYHLASPHDEETVKILQSRDYFKRYTEKLNLTAGGSVTVTPLEILSETEK